MALDLDNLVVGPVLTDWVRGHFGLTGEALPDGAARKLVKSALQRGELSPERFADLVLDGAGSLDERTEAKTLLVASLGDVASGSTGETVFPDIDSFDAAVDAAVTKSVSTFSARKDKKMSDSRWTKAFGGSAAHGVSATAVMGEVGDGQGGSDGQRIRVKNCRESFSTVKGAGLHAKTREEIRPAFLNGAPVQTSSKWEKAMAGVFLKRTAMAAGLNVGWTEQDQSIWEHQVNEEPWCGKVGTEWKTGLRGMEVKALVDSELGAQIAGTSLDPAYFDMAVVTYPLLNGELLPFVDNVDVPRGAMIDGAAIQTPTVVWNNAEGTAQDLFDTSGMVAGWGKSIHPVAVFVQVGLDLLADTPVSLGETLIDLIGERFKAELDKVIAIGSGTDQPEGIFNASSANIVHSTNGSGGPLVMADLEALPFGIAKQYRVPNMNPSFIMSDADYRRARSIPWGAGTAFTAQARALGSGSDYSSYRLLDWPARISNDVAQNTIAFMPLKKYRLYRRQGLEVRWVRDGMQLARSNTALLCCRARYGGFVTDSNALAVMSDAPVHNGTYSALALSGAPAHGYSP